MELTRILRGPSSLASDLRDRDDGGLRPAVHGSVGSRHSGHHGTDVDDAASLGTEMLDGLLRHQKQAEHVEVELLVKMLRP